MQHKSKLSAEYLEAMKKPAQQAQKAEWVTTFKEHVRRMVDGTPIKTFELDFPIRQKSKRSLSWQLKSPTSISFVEWGLDPVIFFIMNRQFNMNKRGACSGEEK